MVDSLNILDSDAFECSSRFFVGLFSVIPKTFFLTAAALCMASDLYTCALGDSYIIIFFVECPGILAGNLVKLRFIFYLCG